MLWHCGVFEVVCYCWRILRGGEWMGGRGGWWVVVVVVQPGVGRSETLLLVCARPDVVCTVDDGFQVKD
jgi:hypothetical protein